MKKLILSTFHSLRQAEASIFDPSENILPTGTPGKVLRRFRSILYQQKDSSYRQAVILATPGQNSHTARQLHLERIEPTVLTIEPRYDTRQATEEHLSAPNRSKQNPLFGGREGTMGSSTREETLLKIRRGELFERPRVSVLDHTSAISLDEFWNKNDISTINRS